MRVKLVKEAKKILKNLLDNSKNSAEYRVGNAIVEALGYLEAGRIEFLDIKTIKGNKQLKEIRISSPLNYRVFFTEYEIFYIILDIKHKKDRKFPQKYFDILSKRIERNKE